MQKLKRQKGEGRQGKNRKAPDPLIELSLDKPLGLRVFASRGSIQDVIEPLKDKLVWRGLSLNEEKASGLASEIVGMEIAQRFTYSGRIGHCHELGIVDGYRSVHGERDWQLIFVHCGDTEKVLEFMVSAIKAAAKSIGGDLRKPKPWEFNPLGL